jgi:hypothetical protein
MKYKKIIADTYEGLLSLVLKKHLLNFDDDGEEDSLVMTEGTLENVLVNISSYLDDLSTLIGEEDVEVDPPRIGFRLVKDGESNFYVANAGFHDIFLSWEEVEQEWLLDCNEGEEAFSFPTTEALNTFLAQYNMYFNKEDADALATESTAEDGGC